MYSEFFNKRLKKFIAFDGIRLHKIGRLSQNCFLYLIFTFVIGLLLNDIFPKFENSKTNNIIILEVIGQIIVLAILIFYLRKIVLLFPYAFSTFTDMSFDQPDISSQYAEQAIILLVIISTQRHLLKKIHYLYEVYNAGKTASGEEEEKDSKKEQSNKISTSGKEKQQQNPQQETNRPQPQLQIQQQVGGTPRQPLAMPVQQPAQMNTTGDFFNNLQYNIASLESPSMSGNSGGLQYSTFDTLPPVTQVEPFFSGSQNHAYDNPTSSPPPFNNNPMNNFYSNPSNVSPMPSNSGASDGFSTNISDLKDFNNTGSVRMPDYNNLMNGAY
jgi:hypothetical protein